MYHRLQFIYLVEKCFFNNAIFYLKSLKYSYYFKQDEDFNFNMKKVGKKRYVEYFSNHNFKLLINRKLKHRLKLKNKKLAIIIYYFPKKYL